jgi:hypothetical protein
MSDVELIALWETLCKMDSKTPIHIGEVVCSPEDLLDALTLAFLDVSLRPLLQAMLFPDRKQTA